MSLNHRELVALRLVDRGGNARHVAEELKLEEHAVYQLFTSINKKMNSGTSRRARKKRSSSAFWRKATSPNERGAACRARPFLPLPAAARGPDARERVQCPNTEYASDPENVASTSDAQRMNVDVCAAHERCDVSRPPRLDQPTPIGASTIRNTTTAHPK